MTYDTTRYGDMGVNGELLIKVIKPGSSKINKMENIFKMWLDQILRLSEPIVEVFYFFPNDTIQGP